MPRSRRRAAQRQRPDLELAWIRRPGANGVIRQFESKVASRPSTRRTSTTTSSSSTSLPQLDQGSSGGRSLFVVTDWMAKRMYDLGYLQELNHDDLQAVFDNILPQFEESTTDPERKFSIPWQGGQTGIFVDTNQAPRSIRSRTSSIPSTRAR